MEEHDSQPMPEKTNDVVSAKSVRHGLCQHCGYYFEGTPIVDGNLRCPECGKLSPLVLESPERRDNRRLGCLLFAVFAIVIPLAIITYMAPSHWRLTGGLAGGVLLLALLPRTLRRVFDV